MAMDQSTAASGWTDPDGHPLDDERTRAVPVAGRSGEDAEAPVRRGRGLGSNRHLGSIAVSFLSVPVAYGLVDYGYNRAMSAIGEGGSADVPQRVLIALAAAGGLFFLAALAGRISAVGPFVAGLVWGVGPLVWVLLDFGSYVDRLNDLPELYDRTGFGLYTAGFALYPAVAGLLIGTAIAGRWRRHHPAPTS